MDYRWLGPELARAQEDTAPDADDAIAKQSGALFSTLHMWSIAVRVEPRAVEALRASHAALAQALAAAPAPGSFAEAVATLAERALAGG